MDQEVLLSELNYEVRSLARDKDILQERCIELERKYKKAKAASKEFEKLMDSICLENSQIEIEDLRSRLEKEVNISKSLLDDLNKSRKLVLERDEQISSLTSKLRDAELKCQQTEDHFTRTSTDLALERARCDELTLSLQESEGLLSQTRADCLAYALENQRLIEEAREANQQIVSLRAKLDAQGVDLIATKKTLRSIQQRDKSITVSQSNTGISTNDEK
ncbi:unnamed protein product [Nippostrongylus brasiliensis]|uniref:Uncharacterized protein n=1 Tax=Nippostrongylus brasiliensis TaxID=27835 RepID=A0A0N4YBJ7_NIPBR|nr:unnamed protein product [Nippostrongylus brasiliensis]